MTSPGWDLVGGDPAPGDPAAYRRLARELADTAEVAHDALGRLRRFSTDVDETIWRGDAADAFAEEVTELPPKLDKLFRSYEAASAGHGRLRPGARRPAVPGPAPAGPG